MPVPFGQAEPPWSLGQLSSCRDSLEGLLISLRHRRGRGFTIMDGAGKTFKLKRQRPSGAQGNQLLHEEQL